MNQEPAAPKASQLERDQKVRAAHAARLLNDGIETRRGRRRVVLTNGDPSSFVIEGRVVVAAEVADRVVELIKGVSVDAIDGTGLVAIDSDGPTVALLNRLAAAGISASPDHVLMSAGRTIIKEGDDPENSGPPSPREPKAKSGAHVVVIDTGIDPKAAGTPWFQRVTIDSSNEDPMYSSGTMLGHGGGHGTFVGGIIRQIAPTCELTVIRALDVHGVGIESEIAAALLAAASLKPQVVVCAFGGYTHNDLPPAAIDAAVARLTKRCIVVAAGGNERQTVRPLWPASLRDVKAIASVESALDGDLKLDANGRARLSWFTNTGPTIEYAAAGRWSSVFGHGDEDPQFETDGTPEHFDGSAQAAGTSMAAAAVAGAIAARCGSSENPIDVWNGLTAATTPITGSTLKAIDVWSGL